MSTSRETVFCEFPEDVADAAAAILFECQASAIRERGVFRIALSGGETAKLMFETLLRDWRDEMEWVRWEVFWVDERAVPTESGHSNYGIAKSSLLAKVPVGTIFRMNGESNDLEQAAREYELTLQAKLPDLRFDLILLGLGAEGHIASLFPEHPALESASFVEAVEVNHNIPRRLTLTLQTINQSRDVLMLAIGEFKAGIVRQVLVDEDPALPATRVLPDSGRIRWILDDAAASNLE